IRCPKASPQPVRPSSVTTLTSRLSMDLAAGCCGPCGLNGMAIRMTSIDAMCMETLLLFGDGGRQVRAVVLLVDLVELAVLDVGVDPLVEPGQEFGIALAHAGTDQRFAHSELLGVAVAGRFVDVGQHGHRAGRDLDLSRGYRGDQG